MVACERSLRQPGLIIVQNVLLHLPVLKHMCLHFLAMKIQGGGAVQFNTKYMGSVFGCNKRMFFICLRDLGIRVTLQPVPSEVAC